MYNFTVAYYLCICIYDSDARKGYSHSVTEDSRMAETCFTRLTFIL
jgi:hypothetical protein